jgi:hypothetical protein
MIDPATGNHGSVHGVQRDTQRAARSGGIWRAWQGDLGRWSKAISDFDFAAKRVENPKVVSELRQRRAAGDGSVRAEEAAREYARRAAQDD